MFERYTEKARRVIFFARYEASQFGSPYIETEHLLLGILREDKALTNRFLRSHASVESIRQQIEKATTIREKVSTSVDLPLSNESKRVLAYAAEEAERLNNKHIGTEHLLLGLLREENCFAAGILNERGIQIASARAQLVDLPPQPAALTHAAVGATTSSLFRDLTQAASEGSLNPIVGRDVELAAIIEILGLAQRNNPILLGAPGSGKTAIVHGFARRLADGAVPTTLAHKRLIEVESLLLTTWTTTSRRFEEFTRFFDSISSADQTILFLDCFQRLSPSPTQDFIPFLKWLLTQPGLQCISITGEQDFVDAAAANPWLLDTFHAIHIRPLDKQSAFDVVRARKATLEKFHGITYSDASVEAALHAGAADSSRGSVLQTALDLLDAAGVHAAIARSIQPEIAEAQKKLRFIADRHQQAIANHEFEKARFYSDEERKESEILRLIQERLNLDAAPVPEVTPDDIQQVLARWSTYPYTP